MFWFFCPSQKAYFNSYLYTKVLFIFKLSHGGLCCRFSLNPAGLNFLSPPAKKFMCDGQKFWGVFDYAESIWTIHFTPNYLLNIGRSKRGGLVDK